LNTGGFWAASARFLQWHAPGTDLEIDGRRARPIRLGATELPWASRPWQLEQEVSNRSLPSAICADDEPEPADAYCRPPRDRCVQHADGDERQQNGCVAEKRPTSPRGDPPHCSPRFSG